MTDEPPASASTAVGEPPPASPPVEAPDRPGAITFRAVLIGSLCAAGLCALVPYNDFVVANTFLVGSYLPLAVVLAIFVLVVLVNAPLHRWRPDKALRAGELAIVLVMCLVASSVPSQGLLRNVLPSLVSPFYLGQSNQQFWDAMARLDLPGWLFPVESVAAGRESPAVVEFYGRTPSDRAMPLGAWVTPLLGWGVFFAGLMTTLVSLAFLFRVQWESNERLAFPLAQLQLSLIEAPAPGRTLNALFSSRAFWITAGAIVVLHSLTALNAYFPRHVTKIPIAYDFTNLLTQDPWRHLPFDVKKATVYFTFVGIAYFIQSRTAFSLWSVWVITQVITMQARTMQGDVPLVAWRDQHFGACLAYLLAVTFLGRLYWIRTVRSFADRDPSFSAARKALVGVLGGLGVMLAWLLFVGVGVNMALLILLVIMVAHVVTSRIVAETGMPFVRTFTTAQQAYMTVPAGTWGGRDVFFASFFTINGAATSRESLLAYAQHGLKIADGAGVRPSQHGRLVALIAWTLLLSVVVGSFASLRVYYGYSSQLTTGELTLENKHALQTMPEENLMRPLTAWAEGRFPRTPHDPLTHFGIGAGVTAVLQVLTWRLAWWPFVPVGYLAAGTVFISQIWFSIMIGWLAKLVVLRLGGARLLQASRPIFVGLIFGEALAAGLWLVVNLVLVQMGIEYQPVRFLPN